MAEELQMRTILNKRSLGRGSMAVLALVLCLSLLAVAGCDRDNIADASQQGDIIFEAAIGSENGLTTRANNSIYDVTAEYYGNCDFHMTVAGRSESGEYNEESSIYEIPSGSSAVIVPKKSSAAKTLRWYSRTKEHNFWGWAVHRDLLDNSAKQLASGDYRIEFKGSTLDETTGADADTWKSDPDEYAETIWKNGEMLEPLIGAKTGPLVYDRDGMYVPLRFSHLVSKIFLNQFYIIDNATGSTDTDVRGHITFYGMPDEAILYTNPVNSAGEHIPPYVEKPENWAYDQLKSVTYAITNKSRTYKWEGYADSGSSIVARDCWYICPELDFDQITFKIELFEYSSGHWVPSTAHGKHGAFYGDFTNVEFKREPGTNYDKGDDTKILHAGEYLVLTINVSEKGNPGVKVELRPWSHADRNASSHVYPGLYSLDEVKYMNTLMASGSDEEKETFYDMYGSGRYTDDDDKSEYPQYKDKDGNDVNLKIIELFDDIGDFSYTNTSGSTHATKASELLIADGYMLDGQGHTVNIDCHSSFTGKRIGNVRDIYLRGYHYTSSSSSGSSYSEYIIYIDKMGQVWKVNPVTFEMTQTQYNMNDFNKNPVSINLQTGAIS